MGTWKQPNYHLVENASGLWKGKKTPLNCLILADLINVFVCSPKTIQTDWDILWNWQKSEDVSEEMKWETKVISFIVWRCTYGCRGGKSCESKHHVCLCVKCVAVYPLLGKSSFIIWLCGLFITVNNTSCRHMTIQTVHSSSFPLFHQPPSVPQLNLRGNLSMCRTVSRTERAPPFISDRLILFVVRSVR